MLDWLPDGWRRLGRKTSGVALERQARSARWVVADVETSGLDVTRDRLIAIGAVAVVDGRVALEDSFELVLQQVGASSPDNILIHRITHSQQAEGVAPADALNAFIDYVGDSPLLGYHADFDRIMIERAVKLHLHLAYGREWLDLAWLAPSTIRTEQARTPRALDDWLLRFDISVAQRHHAPADALATAQLFCAVLPALPRSASCRDLFAMARDHRWLMERVR